MFIEVKQYILKTHRCFEQPVKVDKKLRPICS